MYRVFSVAHKSPSAMEASAILNCDANIVEETRMSKLISFLVKIRYLNLDIDVNKKVSFNLMQIRSLSTISFYIGVPILLYFVSWGLFKMSSNWTSENLFEKVDPTEIFTQFGFSVTNFLLVPFLPLIIAKAASKIPAISFDNALPWPKVGFMLISCDIFVFLGFILNTFPAYFHFQAAAFEQGWISAYLSIVVAFVLTVYMVLCYSLCEILVFSWLDHLVNMLDKQPDDMTSRNHVQMCLELYRQMDDSLGVYFFSSFTLLQFDWIFSLYISISGMMHLDEDTILLLHGNLTLLALKTTGMILLSICCLWQLLHIVLAVDHVKQRYIFS